MCNFFICIMCNFFSLYDDLFRGVNWAKLEITNKWTLLPYSHIVLYWLIMHNIMVYKNSANFSTFLVIQDLQVTVCHPNHYQRTRTLMWNHCQWTQPCYNWLWLQILNQLMCLVSLVTAIRYMMHRLLTVDPK